LYDLYENKKYNVEVPETLTAAELKEKYPELAKPGYTLRLFFGGSEIKDEHKLFQHNLKDEYTIQIIKKQIEV
jgi:hypothetical protein